MEKMLNTDELISALADGQLRGEAFARAVELVSTDAQARANWQAYHLVGDVLRSAETASVLGSPDFVARLRTRLQAEPPAVPVATDFVVAHAYPVRAAGQFVDEMTAANESSVRWKLVAGFASLTAVVAIGWSAWGAAGGNPAQAELAQAAPPAVVGGAGKAPQVMIRDPRLDELLAAHRQAGGSNALQMPAGFLRNATFETSAR